MTAVEAYEHTRHGGTIYRRGWYFRGSEMWHESWPSARVPWQWGPEELGATDWAVVEMPTVNDAMGMISRWLDLNRGYFVSAAIKTEED